MTLHSIPHLYIFMDIWNILSSVQTVAAREGEYGRKGGVRVELGNLMRLVTLERPVRKTAPVGSERPDQSCPELWEYVKRATGVQPEILVRSSADREQGVDQALQVHMLRALADEVEPQVAVLLSGDGRGMDDGIGFYADLQRMHQRGWGIEVVSWDHSCSRAMKAWAQEVGVFVRLDDYYHQVTFVKGGRQADASGFGGRPTAIPWEGTLRTVPVACLASSGTESGN